MAAGPWIFTNGARTNLLDGTVPIASGTFKMALYTSGSNLTVASTTYAGVTAEHSPTTTGYATGGASVDLTLAGTTTVTADIATDPVWTAQASGLTARWAAIYEVGADILCFCLLDSTPADVSATNGNTLTVAAHASGVFTLA